MKALILIIGLILVTSNSSNACDIAGIDIRELIENADEVSKFVENDEDYKNIGDLPADEQEYYSSLAMKPIDFNSEDHKTLGDVKVETVGNDGLSKGISFGSGVKIGRSCVLTAAHVLYGSGYQKISSEHNAKFDGKIYFILGSGNNKKIIDASVFFKMTSPNIDFYSIETKKIAVVKGKKITNSKKIRIFYGHSDLVILKLDNASDDNYKKIAAIKPEELFSDKNYDIEAGRKVFCQGSPTHVGELLIKTSCKASDFKWEQKNARIFSDDDITTRRGVLSNLASSEGMSGGPCYLNDKPGYVFGVVVNGPAKYHGKTPMPLIKFNNKNFVAGNASSIGLLHKLDQRLKAELGYGLDKISENCK